MDVKTLRKAIYETMPSDEPMTVSAVLSAIETLGFEIVKKRPKKAAPPFSTKQRDRARR